MKSGRLTRTEALVLDAVARVPGSAPEISRRLRISAQSVRNQLVKLKKAGYAVAPPARSGRPWTATAEGTAALKLPTIDGRCPDGGEASGRGGLPILGGPTRLRLDTRPDDGEPFERRRHDCANLIACENEWIVARGNEQAMCPRRCPHFTRRNKPVNVGITSTSAETATL